MRTLRWGRPAELRCHQLGKQRHFVMNPQDDKGKDQVLKAPKRRGLGQPAEQESPGRLLGGGADLGRK